MIRTLINILDSLWSFASPSLGRVGVGLLFILSLTGCARMGNPDGGWYDEVPPKVVGASPAEHATNVKTKKITISFSEFVKLDNASENVVICPPQIEMPEINVKGRNIVIQLQDSLKDNTTYTIDFSDAITDVTEQNPLGNYTYVFSTGDHIDTLAVSGYVLNAEDLEPVKGIIVGLYDNLADSAFTTIPMLRTGRTDAMGHFSIRGVAPGQYRAYALMDTDGDFKLSQRSEQLAFSHDIIIPSSKPDTRPDTTWVDSLHIAGIKQIPYTHFLPDDVCLMAFTQTLTDRYLVKTERTDERKITMYFSAGCDSMPKLRGLNFDDKDAFYIEASEKLDTITYWLRDTTLINTDSLQIEATYLVTDTLGNLVSQTDTLDMIPKLSYEKRTKLRNEEIAKWEKAAEKARKKGNEPQPMKRYDLLEPKYQLNAQMAPNENIHLTFPTPLEHIDTAGIHLYSKIDTLWYRSPIQIISGKEPRTYTLMGEWRPGVEYSLEVDSACFRDIYGSTSDAFKSGIKVLGEDEFGSLFVNISLPNALVQILDKSGKVITQQKADNGVAEFYYIKPSTYYLRAIADENDNGKWDTGDYALNQQAEQVYYYPNEVEIKAKWDIKNTFNYNSVPRFRQKPSAMVKQKGSSKKQAVGGRNAKRALQLGIKYDADKVNAIFNKRTEKTVRKAAKKFQSSTKEGTE